MLTYDMEKRGKLPRYEYLYRCIQADILSGKLKDGDRLPSKRALAEHLALSVVTVENAYDQLFSEGYICALPRSGYFVNRVENLPPMPGVKREESHGDVGRTWRYDFSSNTVNGKHFPFSVWSRLMREVLSCGGEELLCRSPFNGMQELRCAIADYLRQNRGIFADPQSIVIGAGTDVLYSLLVQLFGRDRIYAVEDPSYPKITQVYRANGAQVRTLGSDEGGVSMSQLYESGASVLHISPSHHYPTGFVTGISRRTEILAWAQKTDSYVIEDDYDSEFRLVGKPIQPMQRLDTQGRTVYINTFSKTLAPSMRIGYMVLPPTLMEEFRRKLGFYACTVPNFEQLTLARFIDRGYFERHLSRMRNIYRKKRDEIMGLFLNSGYPLEISEEDAGVHFLVRLRTERSDAEVKARAERQGVRLSFLSDFTSDGSGEAHCIVVNYSGV